MGEEGQDEDSDELLPSASGAAAAALLRDVRRLAEESMRICRPELQEALRAGSGGGSGGGSGASGGGGVPLDSLLRLLRLLQRLVAGGAGRLLEPGDTVGGRGRQAGRLGWVLAPLLGAWSTASPFARSTCQTPSLHFWDLSTFCPPLRLLACPACRRAAPGRRRC